MGRMRGLAADLDRGLRRSDVPRRLPAGARRRCSASRWTARTTSPPLRRRWSWSAWTCCRPPTPSPASRWRCGTCSGRSAACRSTSFSAIRVPIRSCPTPRSSSATRAAETLAGCRAARERGFRAVEMRLGSVRPRHAVGRSRPPPGGAGRPRSRRHAAHRCRADLPRGRRCRRGADRHARGGERDLVRGALPRRRL